MQKSNLTLPDIAQFVQYLEKTGWVKIKQDDPNILIYGTHQFGKSAKIGKRSPIVIVPVDDSYSDTQVRIYEAISLIAAFRQVDESDIVSESFRYDFDILRQKIEVPNTHGISLKVMPDLLKQIRDFVSKIAAFEAIPEESRSYLLGKPSKALQQSNDVVKKCLFGHTFAGSFGISIEMPISIFPDMFADVSHIVPTFERKTMERIAIGLENVADGMITGQYDGIVDNFTDGFNADICASMSSMMKTLSSIETSNVEYSFKWSPLIIQDSKVASFKNISLQPDKVIPILDSVNKTMLELNRLNPIQIRGEVISLTNDPTKKETDKKQRRTIRIRCKNTVYNDVEYVFISLNENDYEKACLAHLHHKWISVRGTLIAENNSHRLRAPHNIREIEVPNLLFHND